MQPRRLSSSSVDEIHSAFLAAFSDYLIPMKPTLSDFGEMLKRRGFDPSLSIGSFDGEALVAFTLNGVGAWLGAPAAYDNGTGVVTTHRRRGLGQSVMLASIDACRERGLSTYVLEVIRENRPALELYRSLGFEHSRELRCFVLEGPWPVAVRHPVSVGSDDSLRRVVQWSDVQPSWQNSVESIRRSVGARDVLVVTGEDDVVAGAVVVYATGDVPLIAVKPEVRGRGIGSVLLHAALEKTGRPLRFINVDSAASETIRFLERHGAREIVTQYELALRL